MESFQLVKFNSSVLAQQCERIGEQILNYQKYIDPIGRIISSRGGWQSRFDMSEHNFPFYDEWSGYLFHVLQTTWTESRVEHPFCGNIETVRSRWGNQYEVGCI